MQSAAFAGLAAGALRRCPPVAVACNPLRAPGNGPSDDLLPPKCKSSHTPLIPIPADGGSSSDPMYPYYESNTVWVTLKNGASQRTAFNPNLNPWQNQFESGLYDWSQSASLFKIIPLNERVAFRVNIDFFNVFNIPGIPKPPSSGTGFIDAQFSGNGARALQFGLRLSW